MENKNMIERFDALFYKNHTTRQWISRSGESYGSEHPQMGRAELLRFIEQEIKKVTDKK